ncbi:hypothetical protein [Nocardioides sp.]|uniref:hypothetical protein n=1 Tax=Nocardioides sp. TaxID=35761 RepID=UPI002CF2F37A|nr:hypothetical protein [Nocardioides sp.]HXH80224.1 hypothetical protein [Nocardioides sp.]
MAWFRLALVVVAWAVTLTGCTTQESEKSVPAPSSPVTEVLDEDEQFASYAEPLIEAEVIEWSSVTYDDGSLDDEVMAVTGRLVRGQGSEVTVTVATNPVDMSFLVWGDQVLRRLTAGPATGCWVDVTDTPRWLKPLPAQLDPTYPLTRVRVVRAAVSSVTTMFTGSDALDAFPRGLVRTLSNRSETSESEVHVATRSDSAIAYTVHLGFIPLVEDSHRLGSPAVEVIMTPSSDDSPLEEPPPGTVFQVGGAPTAPCPAEV